MRGGEEGEGRKGKGEETKRGGKGEREGGVSETFCSSLGDTRQSYRQTTAERARPTRFGRAEET